MQTLATYLPAIRPSIHCKGSSHFRVSGQDSDIARIQKMEAHQKSIYASKPFKFIIDGNAIFIHADLVSAHSKPLGRMIEGDMDEARKGEATLKDVDEGTFVRFVEWAYSGHYSAADFSIVAESETLREEADAPAAEFKNFNSETGEVDHGWDDWSSHPSFGGLSTSSKKVKKSSHLARNDLRESFESRKPTGHHEHITVQPPRPNQHPHEDYTDVFLFHARLYVFSDMYHIQPLDVLALANLQATLAKFTLYHERVGDIIQLLRYTYVTMSGMKELRALMTDYIGYEMDTLMNDVEFKNLMIEDGGDLLEDFMTMVQKRI